MKNENTTIDRLNLTLIFFFLDGMILFLLLTIVLELALAALNATEMLTVMRIFEEKRQFVVTDEQLRQLIYAQVK